MKRLLPLVVVIALLMVAAYFYVNRSATAFPEKNRFFYLGTDSATLPAVLDQLEKQEILKSNGIFRMLADRFNYARKVKPGRYRIEKGMSEIEVFRLLKNGSQEPVKLVINKFRTKEDFARYAGRILEPDSADFMAVLNSSDSLRRYSLDTFNAMTAVIPDTYQFFWNTSATGTYSRLYKESQDFWNPDRIQKASALGLSKEEVYSLASIVEEETNKHDEKPIIASVYLNRLKKGMTLGADPTVKFALRDFGIKRILLKHIQEAGSSPYNTYRQKGLPPGPICTPSARSIDAVLNAENTDYLFFCAKADFSGYHAFAVTDQEHLRNARAYQRALDSLKIK
jgi:UPF0755 protein